MEAICFSETSVDFQRTTPRCIPEDSRLLFFLKLVHESVLKITLTSEISVAE
jgi:hypothetical protein